MDGNRFDRLARGLVTTKSRRTFLRGLFAGTAGGFATVAAGARVGAQVVCDAPLIECGGACVDPATDEANCGECGTVCDFANGCESCIGGVCTFACIDDCCPGPLCTELAADPTNCGACGAACAEGLACQSGRCCTPEIEGGACSDEVPCCFGYVCCLGVCGPNSCPCPATPCAEGLICCDTFCLDATTSPENCGDCGVVCGHGEVCIDGACVADPGCPELCAEGTLCCGGQCIDATADPNCGHCGFSCEGVGGICCDGRCHVGDPENCEACGVPCPPGWECRPGAGFGCCLFGEAEGCIVGSDCCFSSQQCCNGVCVFDASYCSCPGGCSPQQACCNGQCVDPYGDVGNCGGCGVSCAAGEVCAGGTCTHEAPVPEEPTGGEAEPPAAPALTTLPSTGVGSVPDHHDSAVGDGLPAAAAAAAAGLSAALLRRLLANRDTSAESDPVD